MAEKNLSKSLLKLDSPELPASPEGQGQVQKILMQQQVQKILKRDKRRVRILTGLTVFLWLLGASGIFLLSYLFFIAIVPKLGSYVRDPEKATGSGELWLMISQGTVKIILASFISLLLAALSTVWLVITSRRVTLRQINACLMDISEQLKQMRQATGK